MITEDYISFETAKLLKEKGFDVYVRSYYEKNEYKTKEEFSENNALWNWNISSFRYSAPTLQMAMKWLREVHNLECDISFNPFSKTSKEPPYWMSISTSKFDNPYHSAILWKSLVRTHFDTYEEACEAAIKYCLENLI